MLNSGLGRKRGKRGWGELRDIEDRGFTGWEFGEGGKGENLAHFILISLWSLFVG